jgi:peptidoglycan/LPS O-acetylase OafA/YrhL
MPSSTAAEAHERFRSVRYFGGLDGLRCFSILAVIWHHSPHPRDVTPLTRGFLGVDLFFVLSGFLITTLLLRERERTGTVSLRGFYARRALRIFPLYYAVLVALVVVVVTLGSGSTTARQFLPVVPWYLTYTSNWGPYESLFAHAWSLATEEQFYLLWPPVLWVLGFVPAAVLLGVFLLANQLLDAGAFGPGTLDFARRMAPFSAIALGVALGMALHRPRGFALVWSLLGRRFAALVPLAALLALTFVPGDIGGLPRLAIHASMTALVAAVVVREDHGLRGPLRVPLIVHMGVVSYGMYLLHQPCLVLTGKLLQRAGVDSLPVFFLLGTMFTVLAATASFRWFESFFLRQKRKLAAA